LPFSPNQSDHSRIPHPIRGALRDRHERWARDAMDAIDHETNDFIADGEVVWSWRQEYFLNYFKGKFSLESAGPD
jgi:hypothetical protein